MRGLRSVLSPRWKSVALAALLVTLLSGCGLPWPFPQPTPDPKLPDAQQIFRPLDSGANAGDVDTLDPAQIQFGFDYDKAQLIFPQLVALDERQQPTDWAAERHEVSADGLTYTFHLRKGMTWSDGVSIDANTFAYSINRALDPCTGSDVANYLYTIKGAAGFNNSACPAGAKASADTLIGKSIIVADPLTLKLTLERPAGYFLAALTYPTSWAVPKQLIDQYADKWTDHLVDGSGFGGNLYRLTRWDHAGHLDFERSERFWGKKPLLRRIEYTLYKDVNVLWGDFKEGKGDLGYMPAAELATASAMKSVAVQQTPTLSYRFVRLNWQLAPFDDVRVRQAFSLALNRNALAPEASRPFLQPTIHLVPEGMPGYNPDLTDAAGRKGKDALTPDLDAARRLASAYAAEKCSGDYSNCPPVSFPIYYGSDSAKMLGEAMINQWRQAFPGWVIQGTGFPRTELTTFSTFPLLLDSWGADYPDPQDFLSLLWTTHAAYNQSHVSVPQADALLAQADGMSDQTARLPLYHLAEQLLVNQGVTIPLYQPLNTYVVRSHVIGWRIAPTYLTPLSVWQTAYIKK